MKPTSIPCPACDHGRVEVEAHVYVTCKTCNGDEVCTPLAAAEFMLDELRAERLLLTAQLERAHAENAVLRMRLKVAA